jgi:ferritin-like metal-binding protein YciE
MKAETLHDLYLKELRDLYASEKLVAKAYEKLADQAKLPELRQALTKHMEQARSQVTRLEQIFQLHNEKPATKSCKGMEGILKEGEEDVASAAPFIRDAAIVGVAERIEHYEIAAYGVVQTYAIHLGFSDAAKLLQATLDEERAMDVNMTELALNRLNMEAAQLA